MKFNIKNKTCNSLLKNKYLLYLVALIALIDILGYIIKEEFSAVLFFYLIGMITYYYTKNMTIVLGTSLIITTLVDVIKNMMGFKEGLNKNIESERKRENFNIEKNYGKKKFDKENFNGKKKSVKNNKPTRRSGYENQKDLNPAKVNKINTNKQVGSLSATEKAHDTLGKVLNPDGTGDVSAAKDMEKKYKKLGKSLGPNGLTSMSESTKELVKQQTELLKGLKEMTPAINKAMGTIGNIDLGGLSKIFGTTMKNMNE